MRQETVEELPAPVVEGHESDSPFKPSYSEGPPLDHHFGEPPSACSCGPTCAPTCCCRCVRCRCRYFVFGDYLVWRPRGFDVNYAVITDSQQSGAMQIGPFRRVNGEYGSGYRAGIGMFLSKCSSLQVVFTSVESRDDDSLSHPTDAGDPDRRLQALVVDQKVGNPFEDWDLGTAQLSLEMQTLDIEYHWKKACCIDAFAGARVARLDQEFRGEFTQFDQVTPGDGGFRDVATDVEFEGAGLRFGMQAQRSLLCGWSAYGRWAANLLAGDFEADLIQLSDDAEPANPPIERLTSYTECEIVPILEFELGLRWHCGRWTVAAGYSVNAWFNVLTSDEFIAAVQANNLIGLGGDTVYFDGAHVRLGTQF